jgi:tRNA wybutosine-synthesizing protein 2
MTEVLHFKAGVIKSTPDPPAERVRKRLAHMAGEEAAKTLPRGYQRIGDVILLKLRSDSMSLGPLIGRLYREELGASAVLSLERVGKGTERAPKVHLLAGTNTETTVKDRGVSWTLDAASLMFSAGNMEERHRVTRLVRQGEKVADLFAGIGYFTIPAAKLGHASEVYAVEKNPVAFSYLERNVIANGVEDCVKAFCGDNRNVELPLEHFDRVFLGYLPSALPFVQRAAGLVSRSGGWLHVHTVVSVRLREKALSIVSEDIRRAGRRPEKLTLRRVKSYGPARDHVVVDASIV